MPLERLGPLGCGIQTGAGAVMNALKVRPGDSFVTFGAGSVGLSAMMAARIVGADVIASRLDLAKELGATHVVNAKNEDVVAAIQRITASGADFALETTG